MRLFSPSCSTLTQSPAFRQASLKSEIRRAYAVIGVVVLVILIILSRGTREELALEIRIAATFGVMALLAVQLSIIAVARWAQRRECALPTWFVALTVIIESLVPTGVFTANILGSDLPPYASLSSPPVFAYGIMVIMATLHLRPVFCILAGAVGAAGYGGLVAYATYGLHLTKPSTGLPHVAYINSALLILISGFAAAWVARELRTHMEAALGEAETRRQMDRIENDLSIARSIQQALLPHSPPNIPFYDIAGWNRPADQTGGDYYDWQTLPDGNWIVTLADVSGHGIGPALVTAACRAYVRASGSHHRDLASLTSHVNRLLASDLPDGRFVTMVSVLIDPAGGPLALLSAGHGPIVLYAGATGTMQDILPQSLPLAIEPDTDFGPPDPITMSKGDVLALVTDGFVEWARPSQSGNREQFGLERLRDSLRRHAHLSSAAMIEAITRDVQTFAQPAPQQDDLTMVIIRRVE